MDISRGGCCRGADTPVLDARCEETRGHSAALGGLEEPGRDAVAGRCGGLGTEHDVVRRGREEDRLLRVVSSAVRRWEGCGFVRAFGGEDAAGSYDGEEVCRLANAEGVDDEVALAAADERGGVSA